MQSKPNLNCQVEKKWQLKLYIDIFHFIAYHKAFLIPWTGGAFAPLGPLLCPTTEEKKWPIAPKPGPYDLY
jgi:glycine cleavage system protein P-like pyridoxal-binding family